MDWTSVRTWIWISLLAVAVVLGGLLLAAGPLARHVAHSEAAKRGLTLEMEDLSVGWFAADLKNATVRLKGVDRIQIDLESVRVEFGLTSPRLRAVVVEGGLLQIDGTIDEVQQQLLAFRKSRPAPPTTKESSGFRRTEVIRNLDLKWSNALGEGSSQTISGIQVERTKDTQRFGADLVELRYKTLSAQIAGSRVTLPPGALELDKAEEFGAAEMRLIYSKPQDPVPAPPSDREPTEVKDPEVPEDDAGEPGLADRLNPDPARVTLLNSGLRIFRTEVTPHLPREIRVDRLGLTYLKGKDKLHVGPSLLTLQKKPGGKVEMEVKPQGETRGTPLSLELAILPQGQENALELEVEGGPVSLHTLGIREGSLGLVGVDQTTLSGRFQARLEADGEIVRGGGQATIEGLALESGRLAEDIVTFPRLMVGGEGELAVDGSRYALTETSLALGEARVSGEFSLDVGEDFVHLSARAKAPLVSCQALLDSAPRGLLGAAERMRFDGTFSLDAGVDADTRKLKDMDVRWDFKNDCIVKAVPGQLDPDQFRTLFRREVIGAGNYPMDREFGPLSVHWVPLEEVSPYVEKALLVTEDGRFFRHNGFDNRAIESAIRDNVRAGGFVRGASTISMQLAKNLYLSRTKTLSRKFQEAALTSLLEQSFDKRELLELYVNVVEFGPGVYGIGPAAEHYFSKHPRDLTPAQAFFICSILPSPTLDYFKSDGTLKDARLAYVHRLLGISAQRGALSQAELDAALEERLILGQADTTPPPQEEPSNPSESAEKKDKRPGDPSFRKAPSLHRPDPPALHPNLLP